MTAKQQNVLREVISRIIQEQVPTMGRDWAIATWELFDKAFPEVKEKL